MSVTLLEQYIRMIVKETKQARVPNQLISPDQQSEELGSEEEADEVVEFSGAGAIAGYALPLGMDPDMAGRKKNAGRRRRK